MRFLRTKGRKSVAVVGAGLGGLTAAAYLAKAGVNVTGVEQHHKPGGYASSFTRGGGRFTFDVSLHQTAAMSGVSGRVIEELGLEGRLERILLPTLGRILMSDLDITLPQANPEALINILSALFPEEKTGITGFVREMVRIAQETAALPDRLNLMDFFLFPKKQKVLWKIRNESLKDTLSRHVESAGAQSLLSFLWGYYGLPPSTLSAFYYCVATGQYIQGGGYCFRPNSGALSNALVEKIEEHGGRVILGKRVEKIITKRKTVSGIYLDDGQTILSDGVISNASGPETFTRLLSAKVLPRRFRKKSEMYRPSLSTFVVWLGLNQEIHDTIREYGNFIIDPFAHDLDAAYQACLAADAGRVPYMVTVFNNAFTGYSPPGTSVVSLTFLCGYAPFKPFEVDYFSGKKDAYRQEKERLARILIERTEARLIPRLSRMIEVMEVGTPLTNVRYTGNAEGAVYGYEQSVVNSFMSRIKNRTPIKGLYLAGAWGEPGGGFTGVMGSGRSAALSIMREWGLN
jgi:phytoene dehydrogenase-like protein